MKKPNQIRNVIEQANPFLKKNPDLLHLFIDKGHIISTGATSLSFEYRYTLNIIITDYAEDLAKIIIPILAYLKINQPEMLENPNKREEAFKFEIDINNNNTLDLSLELTLTERVIQRKLNNGEVQLHYADEPLWQEQLDNLDLDVIFAQGEIYGNS